MDSLFVQGINRFQNENLEIWEFTKADTIFEVVRYKKTYDFSMSYRFKAHPGFSVEFLDGTYVPKNGKFILTNNSNTYIISNDYLVGFREAGDSVKLGKIKR